VGGPEAAWPWAQCAASEAFKPCSPTETREISCGEQTGWEDILFIANVKGIQQR